MLIDNDKRTRKPLYKSGYAVGSLTCWLCNDEKESNSIRHSGKELVIEAGGRRGVHVPISAMACGNEWGLVEVSSGEPKWTIGEMGVLI